MAEMDRPASIESTVTTLSHLFAPSLPRPLSRTHHYWARRKQWCELPSLLMDISAQQGWGLGDTRGWHLTCPVGFGVGFTAVPLCSNPGAALGPGPKLPMLALREVLLGASTNTHRGELSSLLACFLPSLNLILLGSAAAQF